jgi:hypothetical protein
MRFSTVVTAAAVLFLIFSHGPFATAVRSTVALGLNSAASEVRSAPETGDKAAASATVALNQVSVATVAAAKANAKATATMSGSNTTPAPLAAGKSADVAKVQ